MVTFTVYHTVNNHEGVPGWPRLYFRAHKTIQSKGKYCDIGDAFASELGLREEN